MILLIDIGNTRIKWARLIDGRIEGQSAAPHADITSESLQKALQGSMPASRVLIANVGGARIGELTAATIREHWGVEAEFVHSSAQAGGVSNAYREPAKLGVDRWLGVIGAYSLAKQAACVVSVGTAMTIDGVDAKGGHRGGVIVPGPDLMIASLFRNTSEIAQRARGGDSTTALFADNTHGAVEQGAVHALAALADRAVETLQSEVGEPPMLIVTGGASERIVHALRTQPQVIPDLVLRGLAVLAGQGADRS